jgi:uncharacterized membrane protein
MADVFEFSPGVAEHPAYRRVRAGSRGFALLFGALLWAFVALTVFGVWAVLLYRGGVISLGAPGGAISTEGDPPPGYVTFASLSLVHRMVYALVWIVRSAPMVLLFWNLQGLFRLYARGQVFAARNARHLQWVGIALLADAILPFVCHLALHATGFEIDRNWAHMTSLQELLLGSLVLVIAQVMLVGHEIEEDREGFI